MFKFSKTNSNPRNIDAETPNICPHCHVANEPRLLHNWFDKIEDVLISVWQCNYNKCTRVFVASHENDGRIYVVERTLNGMPKGPIWPEPIKNLKDGRTVQTNEERDSRFMDIYKQSLRAEKEGLDEIAGMGYRKAIEYLVKDWAISKNPSKKEEILNLWLSAIIKDFFSGDLKDILDRATWLGNDQSHYNKLFDEYNISHLKELINLIMADLDREFKKRKYIENIEKKK